VAATAHFAGSSTVVFTAIEHLASASGIVDVASEIVAAAFELASTVGSSTVA
jgi:hypothetical protein